MQQGRVQTAWNTLRAQINDQLRDWSAEKQEMPNLSTLWDILVCAEDGQTLKAEARRPLPVQGCKENCSNTQDREVSPAGGEKNGKENQTAFLAQKISVLESIVKKRRSLPRQQVCTFIVAAVDNPLLQFFFNV